MKKTINNLPAADPWHANARKTFLNILLCLALAFLLAGVTGCTNIKQPYNKISYYTLEYDKPQFPDLAPLPISIRIENFDVAPSYNSNKIIYRDASFARDAYSYHKWHANPGNLVRFFLKRDIQGCGLFQGVFPSTAKITPPYTLTGSVDQFLEINQDNSAEAAIEVTITLLDTFDPDITRKILLQKSFSARRACDRKHPQALAKAMSQAMQDISLEIIKSLHQAVSAKKQAHS